jgi:signal transduction histidine kinase/ligand-binding sensor domain-containing protein
LFPLLVLFSRAAWGLDPNRSFEQYLYRRWDRSLFPGGAVHAIAQTPDGYLWIGAQNGLFRFDGVSFRKFDFSKLSPFPAGPVFGLEVDANGGLWILLASPGLLRHHNGVFEVPIPRATLTSGATALGRGISGDVLFSQPEYPSRYRAGRLQEISPSASGLGIEIAITEAADGSVWLGSRDDGLLRIQDGKVSAVPGLPDHKINCLNPSAKGDLWIGTDNGLAHWENGRVVSRDIPAALTHMPILALARDSDSNIWVGTENGMARIDASGNVALDRRHRAGERPVNAIFEDRERNLWVGRPDGLEQYHDIPFFTYESTTKDVSGNQGPLYVDAAGRTWYGPSSGGLQWLRGGERGRVPNFGNDVVYSLAGAPGELWAGTLKSGLIRVRTEGNTYSLRAFTAADGLANGPVVAICRQHNGAIWAGTLNGGISQVRGDHIATYTTADGLDSNAITAIEEGSGETLWIATANGLQRRAKGAWQAPPNQDELPPGRINSLLTDHAGVLWIGTDSGLALARNGRVTAVRNSPPSLQGQILGLADDGRGYLWIVTDSHVVRVVRKALLDSAFAAPALREFDITDGLMSTEGIRCDRPVARDSSQRIWMSLRWGICVVNPAHIASSLPAIPHIESIAVDGDRINSWKPLRLSSGYRRLEFEFLAISLTAPERVRYRYRLDPFDGRWMEPTDMRHAVYTNLSSGSYRFRLVASNGDGAFNGPETTIAVQVVPRFWQELWFQLVSGLAAMLAAFTLYRLRMRRLTSELKLRFEERLAERTRIARELHDTLLQTIQGSKMIADDALEKNTDPAQMSCAMERLSKWLGQAVQEGREALKALRHSTTEGNSLAEALQRAGDECRLQKSMEFELVVEGSSGDMHPIVRDEVYRIGYEAIRNACKHSKATLLNVKLSYLDDLVLRVRDNGIGFQSSADRENTPSHFGLVGMHERAGRIRAKLTISSSPGRGTQVELVLPRSLMFHEYPGDGQRLWTRSHEKASHGAGTMAS